MKTLLTLILLGLGLTLNAQRKKTEVINKDKIGLIECSYNRLIDLDQQDTSMIVFLSFRNMEYQYIIDYGVVGLSAMENSTDIYELISDLREAQVEIVKNSEMSWVRDDYYLRILDKNTLIFRTKEDDYVYIYKKQIPLLIDWLNTVWMDVINFES